MLISDQRMPGMLGGELLAKSREVYPLARRVLLTAYSDIQAAIRAINEAHLDHYLSKPWDPPEDHLFPVVDDLLDAWQAESLPEATGLRLIGHQWATRSHAIKDFLASNLIPYRWLDVERDAEARTLLEAAGVATDALPALLFEDGSRPDQPGAAPGGRAARPFALGGLRRLRPRDRRRGARRPRGRRCTARRKGFARFCSIAMRPADRPGRARASRTTSGSPTASAAAS